MPDVNIRTAPHFHVGQRVVCVDAARNPRLRIVNLLTRGAIYVVRGIDVKPTWAPPGWGVLLEEIRVIHPIGFEWPMQPRRFRPVEDRPTDIEVFRRLLRAVPASAGGDDA